MDIIVYDDNLEFLNFMEESLKSLNSKHSDTLGKFIGCSSEYDVLCYLAAKRDKPAVFLLDIMMGGNKPVGFTLAEQIKRVRSDNQVIYVTDHESSIISSKMLHRVISLGFVFKGSDKFLRELEEVLVAARDVLMGIYFTVETRQSLIRLKYDDIYYFNKKKGTGNVIICHKYGIDSYRDNLVIIKERLPEYFCYSTKEFIVNTQAITNIDKSGKILHFGEHVQCPFSKTRRKELVDWVM
ncbi:MAG: LytTR family transcriptional regulator DNA-binding domain-containing protein [Defluviitaleaceae bacterium]|nr:LytTR family transcriptional regulator DNA-binding domain-containing protein [Defluviitaleaceae bacterium]